MSLLRERLILQGALPEARTVKSLRARVVRALEAPQNAGKEREAPVESGEDPSRIRVFTYCDSDFGDISVLHTAPVRALVIVAGIRLIDRRTPFQSGINRFGQKERWP